MEQFFEIPLVLSIYKGKESDRCYVVVKIGTQW